MTPQQIDKFFEGIDKLQTKHAEFIRHVRPPLIISEHVTPLQISGQGVQLIFKTDYPFPSEIRDDIWAVFNEVFPLYGELPT